MAQSFDHPQPQCVAQVVQGEALDTKTLGTHFLCDAADGLQAVSQPVTAADMRSAAACLSPPHGDAHVPVKLHIHHWQGPSHEPVGPCERRVTPEPERHLPHHRCRALSALVQAAARKPS